MTERILDVQVMSLYYGQIKTLKEKYDGKHCKYWF